MSTEQGLEGSTNLNAKAEVKLPSIEVMLNDLSTRQLSDDTFLKALAVALNSINNDFSKIDNDDLLRAVVNKAMEVQDRLKDTLSDSNKELIQKCVEEMGRREQGGNDIEAFRTAFQRISGELETVDSDYIQLRPNLEDFLDISQDTESTDYDVDTRNQILRNTQLNINTFKNAFEYELRAVQDEIQKISDELAKEKPSMEDIKRIVENYPFYRLGGMLGDMQQISSDLNLLLTDFKTPRQTAELAEDIKSKIPNMDKAINTFDALTRLL